jgi:hypothetical protein
MQYPLVCVTNEVATVQGATLLEAVFESEADTLLKELKRTKDRIEAKRRLINRACNELVFLNRSVITELNEVRKAVAQARGEQFVETDTRSPEEIEAEYRENEIELKKEEELKKAQEKVRRNKASRHAKYWFRKVVNLCHPDKTTDKNLHAYLPVVQANANDGDLLEAIYHSLVDYVKAKKSKSKKYFDMAKARISSLKESLHDLKVRETTLEASSEWKFTTLLGKGKVSDASQLFVEMIKSQIEEANRELEKIRQNKSAESRSDDFSSFMSLMAKIYDYEKS